jgi:hypothetical protein
MPLGSTPLSPTDIAGLASDAGFEGNDLVTATAIGLAESGGNPSAYNPELQAGAPSGQGSYGVWQIYSNVHPQYSISQLQDPQGNANAAYDIYDAAGGFTPWTSYSYVNGVNVGAGNGSYTNFLGQAQAAVDSLLGGSATPAGVDEASALGSDLGDGTQILISPWVIGVALGLGVILVWGLTGD